MANQCGEQSLGKGVHDVSHCLQPCGYRIFLSLVDISSSPLTTILSVWGHDMKSLIPYTRYFTFQRFFVPDTIKIWNNSTRQIQKESANPSDSTRLPLDDFLCSVHGYFSHHLNACPAPHMHQYDDTPMMMMSVFYWKR